MCTAKIQKNKRSIINVNTLNKWLKNTYTKKPHNDPIIYMNIELTRNRDCQSNESRGIYKMHYIAPKCTFNCQVLKFHTYNLAIEPPTVN